MSGIVAEFIDEVGIAAAAACLRADGFERLEAYTPYPVEQLDAAIPRSTRALSVLVFVGGCLGLAIGFGMQWFGAAVSYPINIGGRPLASWPAFIPIAFEVAVLVAVSSGFFGFFALARLPRPYQPIAGIPGFDRATQDRFFLSVDESDARFDAKRIRALLEEFDPCSVVQWRS